MLKNIGIIYNKEILDASKLADKIAQKFKEAKLMNIDNLSENIDIALVIGGDGTFLKAARFFSRYNIPILGFNMGRLGYLAQARPDEYEAIIKKLLKENYSIEKRLMLKAANQIALNDVVVKGENLNRTSTLDLFINNKKICSYVADGLIVSSPTGSTAYSLSAGGPIISPNLNCFIIVPICPHTLNTRPIVIPSDETIEIKIKEKGNLNVSFDGQVDIVVKDKIQIVKNENFANLLVLDEQKDKFYDILKEKLHWLNPLGK